MWTSRAECGIAAFEEAIRLNPSFAAAHVLLGQMYLYAGRREEAIGKFVAFDVKPDRLAGFSLQVHDLIPFASQVRRIQEWLGRRLRKGGTSGQGRRRL